MQPDKMSQLNSSFFDETVGNKFHDPIRLALLRKQVEFDSIADPKTFMMHLFEPLENTKILDVGCGEGTQSVRFALRGAQVHAIDVSQVSIDKTMELARLYNVEDRINAEVCDIHQTAFEDSSFDHVHGVEVLHHLRHHEVGIEISRILKNGGKCIFLEPSANNPIAMFARNFLNGKLGISRRTPDGLGDAPITQANINTFGDKFSELHIHYPKFIFFALAALFGPLKSKKMLRVLRKIDRQCHKIKFLRTLSYIFVLEWKK